MNRTLSNLGPALFMALLILVATVLTKAVHAPWGRLRRPRPSSALGSSAPISTAGRRWLPSPSALLWRQPSSWPAASSLPAIASSSRAMVPILGSSAAVPVVLRKKRLGC